MAYEKIGRGGCVGVRIALLIVGLLIVYFILIQPPRIFVDQHSLAIIIPISIVAVFCLVFAGSFLHTGIFYIPPYLRAPPRACPQCGRILTALPIDIKNCPYCGRKLD
ncbi:MAG: hypothetical protein QXV01_08095 [Candidatus Bathyarchaeia archaeon]